MKNYFGFMLGQSTMEAIILDTYWKNIERLVNISYGVHLS